MEKVHYKDAKVEYRTDIKGWVGADGRYYGDDEHFARACNSDVTDCKTDGCNNIVGTRSYSVCNECRAKNEVEKWKKADKRPVSANDEMYYSESHDKYFNDWSEVEDFCCDEDVTPDSLLLWHCVRDNPPQVDLDVLFEDKIPEVCELEDMVTDEIIAAADHLNQLLTNHRVNCFYPSRVAVELPVALAKGVE